MALPDLGREVLTEPSTSCAHADRVTVLDQSVLAIIEVCRACGAMRDEDKWLGAPIVAFWRRGDAYDLIPVEGHPRSLPTHPARWT